MRLSSTTRRTLPPTLVLFLGLGVGALYAADGPPAQGIPYQGRLELGGMPFTGTTPLSFQLWDAANGGTSLYTEELSVAVNRGAFGVVLGEGGLPDAVFTSDDLYLAVGVGSLPDPTWLAGRQRILPAAQSVRAGRAYNFDVEGPILSGPSDFRITNGTSSVQMGNQGVPGNNEAGDVTVRLEAGGEFTVAEDDGTLRLQTGPGVPGTRIEGDLAVTGSIAAGVRLITCPMAGPSHQDCFCDPGEVAISGGVYGAASGRIVMRESRPVYDGGDERYGWRGACMEVYSSGGLVYASDAPCSGDVYALCARLTPDN